MKETMRAALLVLAGSSSAGAFAMCGHGANGVDYCGPELIQQLYVTEKGSIYVRPTSSLSPAPPGFACTPVSGVYLVLDPTAANFKQLYAALLSARLSAAPVTIVTDPNKSECTITYVEI